ncbi:MAG: 2-amino-4-hydroxy-6-hydroxymethyldihydropteridine diphosphokinase [Proteobacteria bacterium]|nr:MAG: 2-amino-4-hydroxy-6-hydroxymethyldihydropteridine diphosphokinase [Pseudomonadota bacterium]
MTSKPTVAFLGIGSNLHTPVDQVRGAITDISTLAAIRIMRSSSLYLSPPMGPQDQPDFVNAVVMIETFLTALALLDRLQGMERDYGRVRGGVRWGPRPLDLDILLFGDETIECNRLTIPHSGMTERAFVLVPLTEIAPDLILPNGLSVADLARRVPAADLTRLAQG